MSFFLLVCVVPVPCVTDPVSYRRLYECHLESNSELRKCYLLCFSRSRIHSLKEKKHLQVNLLNTRILIASLGIDSVVLLDWIFKNYSGVILQQKIFFPLFILLCRSAHPSFFFFFLMPFLC